MNKTYVVYNKEGRITKAGSCQESMLAVERENCPQGCTLIETKDNKKPAIHYVENGVVKEKVPLNTEYTVDGLSLVFKALPPGTVVRVADYSGVTDSAETEIDFDFPDTYVIRLDPPPKYLNERLEVTLG